MEKYKQKSQLAVVMDKLLLHLFLLGLGVGWFAFLWGISLPSLLAGLSLGFLLLQCVRLFQKMTVQKREQEMRRLIGGELALDKLLIMPPRHAAFQAAMWLLSKAQLELIKTTESGVLCKHGEKKIYVRLVAQHKSLSVSVQQIIDAHKESLIHKMDQCIVCVTAPVSREACAYAETCEVKIQIVSREEMIRLAGMCTPATDEDLSKLGKRGRSGVGWRQWVNHVLAPKRAKRYFLYGLGLAGLYFLTGLWYYPIPSILCLVLCILCKVHRPKEEAFL